MVLNVKDNEYRFEATMKKIVEINKKYSIGNLKDLFFKKAYNVDFEFLADLLMSLATDETKRIFNNDKNKVYDLMENWLEEQNSNAIETLNVEENKIEKEVVDYSKLYDMLADEINIKSFFGKKMSQEEIKSAMNTSIDIDINEITNKAMEKIVSDVVNKEVSVQDLMADQRTITPAFQGFMG